MFESWRSMWGLDWRIPLLQEGLFYLQTCRNWRTVLRGRLYQIPFSKFILWNGQAIHFRGNPPFQIFQEVWRHKQYTPPQYANSPRIVVDIGANIGFFTLYAAARWREARVLAFEPAPENYDLLKQNLFVPQSRLECRQVALADKKGAATFYLKQESGWHSLFGESGATPIVVDTLALEDMMQEYALERIDFLKVDCEGAEYSIFRGREELLCERIGFVAMEYHLVDGHGVQELQALFSRAGFILQIEPPSKWNTGLLYAKNPRLLGDSRA